MPASTRAIPSHCRARARLPVLRRPRAGRSGTPRRSGRRSPSRRSRGRDRARRGRRGPDPGCCGGGELDDPGKGSRGQEHPGETPVSPIACETTSTVRTATRREARPPRKSPMPQKRAPHSASTPPWAGAPRRPPAQNLSRRRRGASRPARRAGSRGRERPPPRFARRVGRGGTRRRGGARRGRRDRGRGSALLDHPQAEVDVSEETALLRLPERRAAAELADAADVVEERGREQEVVAEAWMELSGLAAERRDADRVLEQASRVPVVPVGASGRKRTQSAKLRVADERVDDRGEPGVRDLRREELEEAVELVGVAPQRRRERRRVGILHGLDGAHLELELVRRTARRDRARAPRRPRRTAGRGGRRRSRPVPRRARSRPRARVPGRERRRACGGAPCA